MRRAGLESESFDQTKQNGELGTPGQHAVDEPPTATNDLGWDEDEGLEEGAEVHVQDASLVGLVGLTPAGTDGQQQGEPRLDRPGERSHDHIGPVGFEGIEGRTQSPDAIFELRDDVFLVATVVSLGNHLVLAEAPVVGDEEKIAVIPAQVDLPSLFLDRLAQYDDAVCLLGLVRLVLELRRVFTQ